MERKLFRCRTGRMIFGVCCGLAKYFDLDPVIIRLVFALSLFIPALNGAAVLAYLLLAIIIPVEGSTTVTTEQTVKENLNDIRDTANDLGNSLRANTGSETGGEERTRRRNNILTLIGVFLIVVGTLALLSSFNLFWWFRWEYLGPAVLIVIGILFIISTNRRK